MALTVKNKIWMGTLFLFVLLLLTGGIGIFFMVKIKSDSKNILQDNYETLSYCHTMQQQLASVHNNYRSAINEFGKALAKQQKNITGKYRYGITKEMYQHGAVFIIGKWVYCS